MCGLPGVLGLAVTSFATVTFPPYVSGPTSPTPVTFGGGTYADTSFEDVDYVSAEFLGGLFASTPLWDPAAQRLTITDPKKRAWSFSLDNPFFSVQGTVYNLTYPVRRGPERVYIPLHPLLRVMKSPHGIDIAPLPAGARPPAAPTTPVPVPPGPIVTPNLADSTPPGLISALTLEESPDGVTTVKVLVSPGAQWQGVLTRPHYIVRAFGGSLTAGVPRRLNGTGALQSIEVRQQGKTTQFTLRLRGPRDSASLSPLDDGTGWVITVRPPAPVDSVATRGTIIVDAGHGGKDPGAVVKGVREADVNLAVAKFLRTELEQRGYKVLLTRESDVFKTLQERPKFASDNKGDLFISLHCNSIAGTATRLASVTGYVGYILREAENEEDKAIARRENQAIEEQQGGKGKKTEISPLDWILLEHQLNLYSKQSESLTESIVRNFAGFEIPKYSTGARQAGFFVLVGAYMPAVLFEMGFLTHDRDRRVLASQTGQREIARRLALAIDGFQKTRN
jgi:N-acetylmuramoyl-L-alanine amidase